MLAPYKRDSAARFRRGGAALADDGDRNRGDDRARDQLSIFTYSKSPGLLSMPTFGGEIQEA